MCVQGLTALATPMCEALVAVETLNVSRNSLRSLPAAMRAMASLQARARARVCVCVLGGSDTLARLYTCTKARARTHARCRC